MGPFTNEYNNDTGVLGTDVIKGSSIILELFEPENQIGKSKLKISEVIHGYKDVQNNYGDAMGCNIDINCTQGSNWQAESNSVAMIIVNGNRWCSGVLLNNSCQDYTPNFLTAFHCLDTDSNGILSQQEMNSVQSWVFRFRYKSQSCNGPENLVFYSFSGSTFKAGKGDIDFALLQLNQRPSAQSGITYAGWRRSTNTPTSTASIHHPKGDVMKISIDNHQATTNAQVHSWLGGPDSPINSLWNVGFDEGTTEGGSSGGPLFDQNHKVVGQLRGGTNGCPPITKRYGRFDVSWNGGGTNDTQLSSWLTNDPNIIETNHLPVPIVSGPSLMCFATNANFTFGNIPPGKSVTWSATPSYLISNPTGTAAVINGTATINLAALNISGEVTLTITLSSTNCSNATFSQIFWVGPPAIINQKVDGNSYYAGYQICNGNHYLTVTPYGGDVSTATWTVPNGIPYFVGTNILNFTYSSYNPSGISITSRASNSCGPGPGANYAFYLTRKTFGCTGSFSLSFYPNPSEEELTIAISEINSDSVVEEKILKGVKLINSKGEIVRSTSEEKSKVVLDIRDLPKGDYYIHLYVDGQNVKEHIKIKDTR
jgi:hypothetical protein